MSKNDTNLPSKSKLKELLSLYQESKFEEDMPDIYLVKSEKLIVYDNFNQTMQAIYNANPQKTSYEDAIKKIDEIFLKVHLLCLCYTLEPVVFIGIAFATLSHRGEGKNHVILPMGPTFSDRPSYGNFDFDIEK